MARKTLKILLLILLFKSSFVEAACDCGSTDSANPCTGQSISITVTAGTPNGGTAVDSIYNWSFNSAGGNARCGQFANGDYWIAPAAGQSNVTITNIASNGEVSADVDPVLESMGLLNGENNYGNYNSAENIIPDLPQNYSGIKSIVAAVKRNETLEGNCGTAAIVGECVDSYNVVTILNSVPENAGATVIRPNITGETKELLKFSDFDFTRLPSKTFLTGTDANGFENIRKKWSHSTEIFGVHHAIGSGYSEGGRAFRSHILLDDYGGGVAASWNSDMMIIFSDDNTFEEKKKALAAMLSYGLDLYHDIYDKPNGTTRYWGQGATQSPGKFLPAVFLAALSVNGEKADILKGVAPTINNTKDDLGPHELGQVHNGKLGPVWGDFTSFTGVNYMGAYWESLHESQCYDGATGICYISLGKKTQIDPHGYIDGPPNKPGTNYMSSSLGVQRSFAASMFLMPEVAKIVNYQNLITYLDRIENDGLATSNDPCVTPDSRENISACDAYRNTNCTYYGVTWGPVNVNDEDSDCIKTPTPPYTKVGRFTLINGNNVSASYTSSQVENNWTEIRNSYSDVISPFGPQELDLL